jgi:hypothetical protein
MFSPFRPDTSSQIEKKSTQIEKKEVASINSLSLSLSD